SMHWIGAPAHAPALQVSPLVHDWPSSQLPGVGVKTHPVAGLQESLVHGVPSAQVRGLEAHVCESRQCSFVVQRSVSAQSASPLQQAAIAVCRQPTTLSQTSCVQALPSLQSGGVPARQTPLPQVSMPSHACASAQLVPSSSGMFTQPAAGTQPSCVQGFASL